MVRERQLFNVVEYYTSIKIIVFTLHENSNVWFQNSSDEIPRDGEISQFLYTEW